MIYPAAAHMAKLIKSPGKQLSGAVGHAGMRRGHTHTHTAVVFHSCLVVVVVLLFTLHLAVLLGFGSVCCRLFWGLWAHAMALING